jgi:hypothetical protein
VIYVALWFGFMVVALAIGHSLRSGRLQRLLHFPESGRARTAVWFAVIGLAVVLVGFVQFLSFALYGGYLRVPIGLIFLALGVLWIAIGLRRINALRGGR